MLERLVQMVCSILGGDMPQMSAFVTHIAVSAKLMPVTTVVAQVLHKKLWIQTGTSFLHSPEFGFGRQH